LVQHAHACQSAAVEYYSERANFGGVAGIENGESELLTEIYKLKVMYQGLNDQRNPLAGMETYMLPLAIGFLSFALRWFADLTCSSWSDTVSLSSEDSERDIMERVESFALVAAYYSLNGPHCC